jgi:predicted ATPase
MARLDRLGSAKEVAQIGAAIGRQFSHALLAAIVPTREPELQSALDRLVAAGLLFRQGVPPYASYLFKHALVQDAAYGTLLREPRRALHARIAETIESQFADIAENQPELLARHCAEAGLTEKAIGLWGKAGQRSQARSALVEAEEQFKRALDQIATLPATPALRREQIKLQVALIFPLIHVKGYAAPETKAAIEHARLLIEQAEQLGDPPEDPLLLFSVLWGAGAANYVAFDGSMLRELATEFLALAEAQGTAIPLMIGHRLMGTSLAFTGDLMGGRLHYDQAMVLYDPAVHRPLALQFGHDHKTTALSFRSRTLWMLGFPEAAAIDADNAIKHAREINHAATLLNALYLTTFALILRGNCAAAAAQIDELMELANEKASSFWRAEALPQRGLLIAEAGRAFDGAQLITSGIAALRSTGGTVETPWYLSHLANIYAKLDRFDDAQRYLSEAMMAIETTKERWFEAEASRIAGQIALLSPEPNAAKAQAYFERGLAVARKQRAKSWELRAAMSMARLWRDQGKRTEARDLLAPIYGWFTEGFDTRDLKEAKALLEQLAS